MKEVDDVRVREMLAIAVQIAGSQAACAKRIGISQKHLERLMPRFPPRKG